MRALVALVLLALPALAWGDVSTKHPTGASGSGWTNPGNFADGSTSTAATYDVPAFLDSTDLVGSNLNFSIPSDATVTQVRSRLYWRSSSCSSGGVNAGWDVRVSGVTRGSGAENCKTTAGWSAWFTHTGTWAPGDFANGTLTLAAMGSNDNESVSRTLSVYEGEVEVTYTPASGARPHVGIWSMRVEQPRSRGPG
jgi:hypothetical protein